MNHSRLTEWDMAAADEDTERENEGNHQIPYPPFSKGELQMCYNEEQTDSCQLPAGMTRLIGITL